MVYIVIAFFVITYIGQKIENEWNEREDRIQDLEDRIDEKFPDRDYEDDYS